MAEINITMDTFGSEVLSSAVPVLVDFWADWCGPCRMLAPILHSLAEELGDSAKICKVNVDSEAELAERYGISAIPTMILFKNGEPVKTLTGLRPKAELKKLFD